MSDIVDRLGEVGLPAPMAELTSKTWDAVVVGGGHNGLTAAAYLARAGRSRARARARERLGGACTLERPFDDQRYVVSPCAYVVGLLDQTVIDELGLSDRGLKVFVADPNLWAPFADGTSFAQWDDDARTQADLEAPRRERRRHQGLLGVRGDLRRDAQAPAHGRPRQRGSARHRPGPSSRRCSAATRR